MRQKKTLSAQDKQYLLSIKPEEIDKKLLQSLFADTYSIADKKIKPSRFNTYDEFSLKKGEYFNTEDIKITNVGLFIFNKYIVERSLKHVLGYINEPLTKDKVGEIWDTMDAALREDVITSEVYIKFLDDISWYAFTLNGDICSSLTIHSMKELPEVAKAKKDYMNKHADVLNGSDNNMAVNAAAEMEKMLVDVAKKEMQSDPAADLYESGARGNYKVAYKNAQIMQGPVWNSAKKEYTIMYSSIARGIEKTDIPTVANSSIDGSYSTAIATGECGYLTKKMAAAFQGVILDKKGSDCGSKSTIDVFLTKKNFDKYMYRYIVEGGKLVRLDNSNKNKYIGKTVKMRTISLCVGKTKRCNICAGDMFYVLGIENIGLTSPKMSNTMMQRRLKAKHDATVSMTHLNPEEDFT